MRLRTLGKLLLYALAGLTMLTGLLLLGLRIALDRAPHYQAEIKRWLLQTTGYPMEFAHVSPSFRWTGPELYLDRLELRSKDGRRVIARAAGGRVGADLWQLWHGGPLFALRIELDEPVITVTRVGPGSFSLASEITLGGEQPSGRTLKDWPDGTLSIRRGRVLVLGWNATLPHLALEGVDLDLRHGSDLLAIRFAGRLPAVLGGTLKLAGAARGSGLASTLVWSGTLSAHGISFGGWRDLLPEYLPRLDGGTGSFDLRLDGRGAALDRAELGFDARELTTKLNEGPDTRFTEVSGTLGLRHSADRWTLEGRRLRALIPGRHDPESQFDVSWRGSDDGLLELDARANYLRAETLLPLAGLMPQRELRSRLRDIAPTGEWLDMRVHLARAAVADPWTLDCRARFRDVGFAAVGRAPGLRGLSGWLAGNQSGGRVVLAGSTAVLNWPNQFLLPLDLDDFATTLYWKRTPEAFLVATPQIALSTHGVSLKAKVAWSSPSDDSSPQLTLAGTLAGGEAGAARLFFPHQNLPAPVLAWLDRAFIKGHLAHADLVFSGPVRHFPFRDGSGVFLARAFIEGLTLDYREGWPRLENLDGVAEFRNEGLAMRIKSGRGAGLDIDTAEARFADLNSGELEIRAQAHGDAADALGFLRASPLDAMAEHGFSAAKAGGPIDCRLDLMLPFRQFDRRRVLVHLDLHGDTLARVGSSESASEVTGEADIDGAQVARADVHGRLLGGAFQMTARAPRSRHPLRTQLDFRGTLSGEALRAALSLPATVRFDGETDWRAVLRMAPDPARERSLRVSSTLSGLALGLPAPLDKPAGSSLPAAVAIQWPAAGGMQIRAALDGVVQGAVNLDADDTGYALGRAAIALGAGDPVYSDAQPVNVTGRIERLDLAGWLRLAALPRGSKPLPTSYVRGAAFEVSEIDYLGLTFRDVTLTLAAQEGGWRIAVGGPNAAGVISLPGDAALPWTIAFERLKVFDPPAATDPTAVGAASDAGASPASGADPAGTYDPRSLPAINLHVGALSFDEREFGDVRATLVHLEDGVGLKLLTLAGASFNASATGEWRGQDGGTARIQGQITSSDVGATLAQLGFDQVIQAKSGKLEFNLHWLGAPTAASLAAAAGRVQVALDNGQIVHLKPGAGRVLGLASIAELPRRLAFDFSDLTDKGFAFDTIRGDFDLKDGSAYTDDVLVRGPAAEIGLIGRVGLKMKDYDQTAVVTGNVANSPLPLAAFAGGPVVGAAVVLFTQVFKQPLKGLVRGYYRITGSWENPTVERIRSASAATATAEAPK